MPQVRGLVYDGAFHIYRRAGTARTSGEAPVESGPEGATPRVRWIRRCLGQIAFLL